MSPVISSIVLLGLSSCFMITAWYGHLKFEGTPMWKAIIFSWLIAGLEYSLQVPGNRIGHEVMSAAQLRIIAEFFTLAAFVVFQVWVLREAFTINEFVAFALVFAAVYVAVFGPFKK